MSAPLFPDTAPDSNSRDPMRLAMPPQPLNGRGAERQPLRRSAVGSPSNPLGARLFMAIATLAMTVSFGWGLVQALALADGGTVLHYTFLVVSTLGFLWMAFGAVNAAVGAYVLATGRRGDTVNLAPALTPLYERTALLFPIYHEDPEVVAETITNLLDDLERNGVLGNFAIFVLSDSQNEASRKIEKKIFGALTREVASRLPVTYRNRERNVGKKAGNISEWVTRWGHDFDHFIVFDADSRMSTGTLTRLVATMQQQADTALIQTVPALVGSQTTFGRLQEFSSALSGKIAAAGYAAWQGDSGNYWGHNAIIRTRAFAACAGLPILQGAAPFGGHIQSHDFVEAAFLRRAGWRVALVSSLDGSYEGTPQSLVDMAVRDRRWMQGNLQHGAILSADGLHPVSRLHLAMGIASYLSSALWAAMVALGLSLVWQDQERTLRYFSDQKTLFPVWPTFDPQVGLWLLLATLVVVFLPKLIGLCVAIVLGARRGVGLLTLWRTFAGWWVEVIYSALLAPVSMMLHLKGLSEILLGRDSGWRTQKRVGDGVGLIVAARFHMLHVAAGLALAAIAAALSWHAFLWVSPMAIGLIVSPILTRLTSLPASESLVTLLRSEDLTMPSAFNAKPLR